MTAKIKYKFTECGIYIKMNTCRFMHKKNSDYPNHNANSILFFNPRTIKIYSICPCAIYFKRFELFPSINPNHFNHCISDFDKHCDIKWIRDGLHRPKECMDSWTDMLGQRYKLSEWEVVSSISVWGRQSLFLMALFPSAFHIWLPGLFWGWREASNECLAQKG